MSSETITTYRIDKPDVAIPMDRAEFYIEQITRFETGQKPTQAVGIVNLFIFDSQGELFVQKRSDHKTHNAMPACSIRQLVAIFDLAIPTNIR